MKNGLKLKESVAFFFIELGYGNLGPHCNNLSNIILTDAALADILIGLTLFKSFIVFLDKLVLF